ncbi:MAG: alpha/beta hydrolase [Nitriliruptorales bacterium]|nr:alpha/beta hydrolase [Nitriliruptorales bacterium]
MIYAWRFPDSIHRSVLVGVNPPGNFLWYPETTEEQVGRYAALCANDDSCSRRTDDLAATLQRNSADVPDRWLFLPIKEANARTASMLGLFESTTAAFPIAAPMILDAWLAANEGDASGLWFISTLSDLVVSGLFVHGQYAAAGQLDAQAAREYFADASLDVSNFGVAGTASTWAGGRLADAWPAHRGGDYSQVPTSEVDMLLIGGELDVSTPPQNATRELLPYLPNGHEVVLAGFGHTGTFFAEQPDAGTHLIRTYLDSGRIDDSLYEPVLVDFTPPMTLTGIAKILLATMLLFVLISLLSLAWMAHHVRKRGGFGPAAGALLRSLYPVVLGLGGWFLGVLIALTTMPRVTVDNELLAIGAVCPPIALGIYYAWTHRDRPIDTRRMGLVLASGGAIAGGWFGFNAAGVAFIGLWFAIVGAIAGANLLLILLDIATARSVVRRPGLSVPLEPSREPIRR